MNKSIEIKDIFSCISGIFSFAIFSGIVFAALFFYSIFTASAVQPPDSIILEEPAQDCLNAARIVNLSWASNINGSPTYVILRKKAPEAVYAEIGATHNLNYQDNTAISDQSYQYQIQVASTFSNEAAASANYCPSKFITPGAGDAECKTDGPRNNLSWIGASGSLSKYEIYRKNETAGGLIFNKIGEVLPGATVYSDGPGIIGTNNYIYFIRTIWLDAATADSQQRPIAALACSPSLTVDSTCNVVSPGGPAVNLSWNNLLGVIRYEIYREAPGETSYVLLVSITDSSTAYSDNLAASLPLSYWIGGDISYFVKAIWIKDTVEISQSSLPQTRAISRCAPFVSVAGMCDAFNNPEMRLSWTRTAGADLYNLYRDNTVFIKQIAGAENSYVDYLNSTTCPGGICAHSYRNEASVTGFPNFISESTASQDIDCVTVVPPSPTPVLSDPIVFCESNKSKISLSWSSSDNAIYYTLYRNGEALINLSSTSYIDTGVESGINYNYSARAFGRSGTSTSMSDIKNISAVSCVPPAAPALSLAKSCSANMPQVNLLWSVSSADNIVNYEIKRRLSTEPSLVTKYIINNPSATSKLDSEVETSKDYYYQVIANSVLGVNSSSSLIESITTDSCLPTTPAVILSTYCASGSAKAKVDWTSNKANTDHFEIFRQDISGGLAPVASIPLAGTSYSWVDPNFLGQTTLYNYKVVAVGQLSSKTATQGYKPITTYNCALPGAFTLTDPPNVYCQGSYPRADLSWTTSTNSTSYDLNRLLANTTTFSGLTSISFTDWGFGNALSFNVASYVSSYVNLGNPAIPLTGNLTIEFWANPSYITYARQNPICKAYWAEFCLTMETSGSLSYYHGNGSSYMSFSTPNVFTSNNKWVHVVITRDASTRTMRFYKNGVFANSTTWTSAYDPVSRTDLLRIGAGYVSNFRGIIDEPRIYNRALSTTEAQEHYQGIYTSESGLIGLWHFDESSGLTASDSSNYGNNGTLVNGPTWIQSGLQSQTNYSWQTKAISPGGTTLSNTTSPTALPLCLPTKPGLTLSTFCEGGANPAVRLNWSYSINALIYEIYRDGALINAVSQSDPKTWIDNNNGAGLNNETSYAYYIKAVGPTGLINQSNSRSITTPLCVLPTKTENLSAAFSCSGSYPRVNLAWDASTNATGYSIYRNINGGSYSFLAATSATAYPNVSPSVNVNTAYSYYIVATGPGGSSVPSDLASVPSGQYCPPSIPVIITPVNGGCLSNVAYNTINWNDATTFNTQQYKIYRNTINTFDPLKLARTIDKSAELALFNSRSWQDTGLLDNQDYFYWVKAIGPVGGLESAVSAVATRRTNICTLPPAPNISPSSINDICTSYNDPITLLYWNKTSNTTSYNIYKNGVSNKTITPDASGYIKNWLIIGGFSYTGTDYATVLATDYLGGETSVKPRAGKSAGGKTWFEYSVPSSNYTDFTLTSAPMSALTPKTYASAYAFAYVYSPIAQTAQLRIGSDDGVKAFFNGAAIYTNTAQRGASPDQDIKNINLVAGMNYLLIKVQQGASGWGLYARITNTSGSNLLNDVTAWDSGAVVGVVANYNISSVGPGGTSNPTSNIASSAPLNCNPLTPDLTLTPGCNGPNTQMTLSWPADSNTYYWNIHKKRSSDPSFTLLNPPGNITNMSYIDMNVASNTSYDYYVTAYASGGIYRDSFSKTALVSPCYDAPIKPVITVTPQCAGSASRIKINWAPYDNAKTLSFNVYRKDITAGEPDFTKIFENLSPFATEFSDGNVIASDSYSYRVEAVGSGTNNYAMSDITAASEGIAIDCLNIPPFNPPTLNLNFSAYTVQNGGSVSLRWTDTQNETKYKVFRRIKDSGPFAYQKQNSWLDYLKSIFGRISSAAYDNPIAILLPGADYADPPAFGVINYIDNTVAEDNTYEYQVIAVNNAGGADAGLTYSNIISPVFVPIALPAASALSYSVIGPNKIKLQWVRPNPSSNEYTATGGYPLYEIQKSPTLDFSSYAILGTKCSNIIYNGSKRACDLEVLSAELNYIDSNASSAAAYYRVITENYGGRSSSNIVSGSAILKWKEVIPR